MSFDLMTLNTWGTPYAKHHPERMTAIAQRLLQLAPDVIALQEMYREPDRQLMITALRDTYPYRHYFASCLLGSGLMTFSRYPIVDAVFYRFRMGGKPEKFWRGDYFAGKGIGLARIDLPDGPINVFNCHTHAQYDHAIDNEYAAYTQSNLYEAARIVYNHQALPCVLCGDLNTRPDRLGYRLITTLAHLDDAYTLAHPDDKNGFTFHTDNPYVSTESERLDYILLHGLRADAIEITMTERLTNNGPAQAYSDHYALKATITPANTQSQTHTDAACAALEELLRNLRAAQADVALERQRVNNRSLLGFAAIGDSVLFTSSRRQSALVRQLSRFLFLGALIYGGVNAAHSFLSLRPRAATLDALIAEVEHQIRARRVFNGTSCD